MVADDQGTGERGASSDGLSSGSLPPPPPPPPFTPVGAPELLVAVDAPPSRRRGRLVLALVAVLGLVGAGVAVALGGSDGLDPDEALTDAQTAVEDEGSFHFEVRTVFRSSMGEADGPGSDTTTRTLITGDFVQRDRWRQVTDDGLTPEMGGMGPYEVVRIGDSIFERVDATTTGPQWVEGPADMYQQSPEDVADWYASMEEDGGVEDPFLAQARLQLIVASYLADFDEGSPEVLTRLVTEATDPEVAESDSSTGVRITAQLAPIPEIAAIAHDDVPPITMTLELDEDHVPVTVTFVAETKGASADVEVRFSDWGADIDVDAPDLADIDATPWLSEEALAEWPQLLVAPTALPPGFELTSATLMEDPADEGCPTVYLDYSTQAVAELLEQDLSPTEMEEAWSAIDQLTVMTSPGSCAESWDPAPFDELFAGLPARGEPGYREVLVGDVWLIVSSTLDDAVVESLVGSVVSTDLDTISASIPTWATTGLG